MNPIPAGSLLHIQKHLLPGKGGQWKGRRNFQTFGKGKKSIQEVSSAIHSGLKEPFSCVWGDSVKERCYEIVEAVRPETSTNTVIPGCLSVCLCLSVHSPARESTHLLPLQLQPSPCSMVRTAGLGVCIAPAAISKHGAAWHIPQAPPIMGFAHLILLFIELWNQNHVDCNKPLMVT